MSPTEVSNNYVLLLSLLTKHFHLYVVLTQLALWRSNSFFVFVFYISGNWGSNGTSGRAGSQILWLIVNASSNTPQLLYQSHTSRNILIQNSVQKARASWHLILTNTTNYHSMSQLQKHLCWVTHLPIAWGTLE